MLSVFYYIFIYFIQTSPETSQSLVNSTEQFGKLLGATLNNETNEVIKTKENIGT